MGRTLKINGERYLDASLQNLSADVWGGSRNDLLKRAEEQIKILMDPDGLHYVAEDTLFIIAYILRVAPDNDPDEIIEIEYN